MIGFSAVSRAPRRFELAHHMHLVFWGARADLCQLQGIFIPKNHWMACMAKESAIGDLLVRAGIIDSSGLSRARGSEERWDFSQQGPCNCGTGLHRLSGASLAR